MFNKYDALLMIMGVLIFKGVVFDALNILPLTLPAILSYALLFYAVFIDPPV
jgi:hypothetical protein